MFSHVLLHFIIYMFSILFYSRLTMRFIIPHLNGIKISQNPKMFMHFMCQMFLPILVPFFLFAVAFYLSPSLYLLIHLCDILDGSAQLKEKHRRLERYRRRMTRSFVMSGMCFHPSDFCSVAPYEHVQHNI